MRDFYYELYIAVADKKSLFIDLAFELGASAVEEKEEAIILRSADPLDDIKWGIKEFAKKLGIKIDTICKNKPNIDWIKKYQESVKSIEVGRFNIHPSWTEAKAGFENITIDPALAFGSGHHQSTNACLEAIQKYVKKNDAVLDVGCGSGILSIACAKLEALVDICDTDEVALKSSSTNFALNNVAFGNSWVGSASMATKEYDVVLANIIADVLIMISKDLKNNLKQGGYLILSGILEKYLGKVRAKFIDLKIVEKIKKDEWFTLILKKEKV